MRKNTRFTTALLPLAIAQALAGHAWAAPTDAAGAMPMRAVEVNADSLLGCLQSVSREFDVKIVFADAVRDRPCAGYQGQRDLAQVMDAVIDTHDLRWERSSQSEVLVRMNAPQSMKVALNTLDVRSAPLLAAPAESNADRPEAMQDWQAMTARDAISRTTLDERELAVLPNPDLDHLLRYAPNVYGSGNGFAIRGVPRENVSRVYSNVLLDGLPVPYALLESDMIDGIGLTQVQFERLPNHRDGASGSFGGAVRLNTAEASIAPAGAVSLQADQDGGWLANASWQGGWWNDSIASRIAVTSAKDAGSICLVNSNRCDLDESDTQAILFKTLIQPESMPDFTLGFNAYAMDSSSGSDLIKTRAFIPVEQFRFDRVHHANASGVQDNTAFGIGMDARWAMDNGEWRLRGHHVKQDGDERRVFFGLQSAQEGLPISLTDETRQMLELAWQSKGDALQWNAGASIERREFPFAYIAYSPITGLTSDSDRVFLVTREDVDFQSRNWQLFGGLDWQATDTLKLSAQLRWLDERTEDNRVVSSGFTPGECRIFLQLQNTVVPCSQAIPFSVQPAGGEADTSTLLPSLHAAWLFAPNHALNVHAVRGHVSGGSNVLLGTGINPNYEAETGDTFEMSWTGAWLDERLQSELTLFHTDWKDRQIRSFVPEQSRIFVTNVARASAEGGEWSLRFNVNEHWWMRMGYGHLNAKLDRGTSATLPPAVVDYSGNTLPLSPKHTAVFALGWQDNGWFANLTAYHAANAYSEISNVPGSMLPAYTSVDASAGYRAEQWSLSVFGKNVLDEPIVEWIDAAFNVPDHYQMGDPARYGVKFEYRF